ncbi:calcium-binding protein [Palleronia pelagia]|nr:calcium-binding protein [Palleronia pelagia]
MPDDQTTLSYTIVSAGDGGALQNALPEVEIEIRAFEASVGFVNGVDVFPDDGRYTTHIGQVDWGQGLSSTVLQFQADNGFQSDNLFFVLAGDPFPGFSTLNIDAFVASIISVSAASGAYGPGQPIDLSEAPNTFIRDLPAEFLPRELTGGAAGELMEGGVADDFIDGGAGNDTLRGLDGADTLIGGAGDDLIEGGATAADLRDVVYGGDGDDIIDGGYGNDELRGDAGNDDIAGGFGADTVIGGTGDDTLTGSAFGDEIFGGDGFDFINGGFGSDRVNGGVGGDRFFHLGIADHGNDWIQDYDASQGDVLVYGGSATRSQFQVNVTTTPTAGADGVQEAFVIYRPTGQILWALVDGDGQDAINLSLGGQVFDLTV